MTYLPPEAVLYWLIRTSGDYVEDECGTVVGAAPLYMTHGGGYVGVCSTGMMYAVIHDWRRKWKRKEIPESVWYNLWVKVSVREKDDPAVRLSAPKGEEVLVKGNFEEHGMIVDYIAYVPGSVQSPSYSGRQKGKKKLRTFRRKLGAHRNALRGKR
ncbi:MAG: hypothetical protein ABIO70_15915 [Pseudomonadota bacterium]